MSGRVGALVAWSAATLLLAACSLLPPMGCPTALLEGRLALSDDGGTAVVNETGENPVTWPDGFSVELTPEIVLRDQLGRIVASEGDTIYVGGGQDPDNPDSFKACGHVSTDPP